MSRFLWPWLRHPASWGGAPVAVLSVLLSAQAARDVDPYWLDISAKATVSVLFLAPGLAALTAWGARRWRSSQARVSVRHPLAVATMSVLPGVGWAAVALTASLAVVAALAGAAPGLPHLGLLALALAVVATSCLLGHLLGSRLPAVYAVPAVFCAAWLWLTFPPTVEPVWLRNVTGNLGTSCCALGQSLAPHALLGPALVLTTALLGALIVISSRRRALPVAVALLLVAGGLAGGRSLVHGLGPDPVRDRVGASACSASSPRVCAWPEHAKDLARVTPVVAEATDRLRAAGVPAPSLVTEQVSGDPTVWTAGFAGGPAQWRASVAEAPVRTLPPACVNDQRGRWPAAEAYLPLRAWLSVVAGAPLDAAVDPATRSDVDRLRRLPAATQRAWYTSNLAALRTCTRPATTIPAP